MTNNIYERLPGLAANARNFVNQVDAPTLHDRLNKLATACDEAHAEIAVLRAGTQKWMNINDAEPPCDGSAVFIGVDSNGYCACFNNILMTVKFGCIFIYEAAPMHRQVTYGLECWKPLEIPSNQF